MSGVLHERMNRRGELLHNTIEGALLTAGPLFFALVTVLIVGLGVLAFRAG